jgi:hypothetical protein
MVVLFVPLPLCRRLKDKINLFNSVNISESVFRQKIMVT